jgi:hypothetical protein
VVHEKECMRYMQLYENTFTKLQSIELRNFYINATSPFKIMYDKCNEINSSQWREYVNFYNKLWNLRNSINSLSSQFFDNVNMLSNDDKIKLKELIYNYFEFCKQYFEYKDNGVVVKNDANKFVRDYFIESQHLFNQDYNKYQFLLNQIARPPTTANNGVG